MRRFFAGALLVAYIWVVYEWLKNPMGHRDGESLRETHEGHLSEDRKAYWLPGHNGKDCVEQ